MLLNEYYSFFLSEPPVRRFSDFGWAMSGVEDFQKDSTKSHKTDTIGSQLSGFGFITTEADNMVVDSKT